MDISDEINVVSMSSDMFTHQKNVIQNTFKSPALFSLSERSATPLPVFIRPPPHSSLALTASSTGLTDPVAKCYIATIQCHTLSTHKPSVQSKHNSVARNPRFHVFKDPTVCYHSISHRWPGGIIYTLNPE